MERTSVSIVGGSGYAGGELLRLLLGHPKVEVTQVTSERFANSFVYRIHPNLRGKTRLRFISSDDLAACDHMFLALPHGVAQQRIGELPDGDAGEELVDQARFPVDAFGRHKVAGLGFHPAGRGNAA